MPSLLLSAFLSSLLLTIAHSSEPAVTKRQLLSRRLIAGDLGKHADKLDKLSPPANATTSSKQKIGIIGAGVAGLQAALMLQDLGIDYEILEAQERTGGRLFTYHFNGEKGAKAARGTEAYYDYVDIGGMRYPNNRGISGQTFNLLRRIGVDKLLIPYIFTAPNQITYYNKIRYIGPVPAGDAFNMSISAGGNIPDNFLSRSPSDWLYTAYEPFMRRFEEAGAAVTDEDERTEWHAAFENLEGISRLSAQSFLQQHLGFPNAVVSWLETFNWGTTGFASMSAAESVLYTLDFSPHGTTKYYDDKADWLAIDGGSEKIITGLLNNLVKKPILGKHVTAIAEDSSGLTVQVLGEKRLRRYSQVICTTTAPIIRQSIDLSGVSTTYTQSDALRTLTYGTGAKVGIRFARRWWQDKKVMKGKVIKGGVSSSDLPLRRVVYPSYGDLDSPDVPGVMLASYTWEQDAIRWAAYHDVKPGSAAYNRALNEVLNQLAELHNIQVRDMGKVLGLKIWSWDADAYTLGAYGVFGPGQYFDDDNTGAMSAYTSLVMPSSQGRLHFAGEHVSFAHGWICGAIQSAWKSVFHVVYGDQRQQARLIKTWPPPPDYNLEDLNNLARLSRKLT